MTAPAACAGCLARSWLLARLAGHIDLERARVPALLDLCDHDLLAALGGRDEETIRAELEAFDEGAYRAGCAQAGVEAICRCDPAYPGALWSLSAEPAVLHVAGGMERFLALTAQDGVALVGARRASPYALENARSLGRGLGRSQVTVISGMASGVDAAAHEGALEMSGATIAVLPSAPERAYPAAARGLHRRIVAQGAVVAELGPDVAVRRWMFPARNRIVAALSRMTVLVAARQGSGAMDTALQACHLRREVGAVPGQVTAPLSFGPHVLLKTGAHLIADASDILIALFGADAPPCHRTERPRDPGLGALFDAIADGYELSAAFEAAGLDAERGLAALAELEMTGFVRRRPGGRFLVTG